MLKVTTTTGRIYLVDTENQFWMRLNKDGSKNQWERIWSLQCGTYFSHPWTAPAETWEDGDPVVGKYMHVASRNNWWTTTKVVSIEEVDKNFLETA